MATEKRETATRDENGVRKQSYKRFKAGRDYEEIETAQAVALCEMMLDGFRAATKEAEKGKGGRPRKLETVEEFREIAENYINYIKERALHLAERHQESRSCTVRNGRKYILCSY